jgi:hypothetical protein
MFCDRIPTEGYCQSVAAMRGGHPNEANNLQIYDEILMLGNIDWQ